MCNLSEGIEERAAAKATEIATEKATKDATRRIIINMFDNKFSIEQIALATGKNVREIERIIRECEPILV